MKIFLQTEKNDKDIEIQQRKYYISFVLYDKYMSATNWEGERRAEGIIFLVHLLKFESDTAASKNIRIIRL